MHETAGVVVETLEQSGGHGGCDGPSAVGAEQENNEASGRGLRQHNVHVPKKIIAWVVVDVEQFHAVPIQKFRLAFMKSHELVSAAIHRDDEVKIFWVEILDVVFGTFEAEAAFGRGVHASGDHGFSIIFQGFAESEVGTNCVGIGVFVGNNHNALRPLEQVFCFLKFVDEGVFFHRA